jgi:hypothetical protein
MPKSSTLALFAITALLTPTFGSAADDHQYTGVKDCGRCHKKELVGDQLAEWEKGPHAKAYETLKGDDAKRIAEEKGMSVAPHESPECLRCHATAHGLEKDQIYKKPLRLEDGVQCESCHGPGSDYRKKTVHAKSRDKGIEAGMWEPGKNDEICVTCHNSESPTFDTAKGFDLEARLKEIEHPIPKDAKGRVLELEKAARKK